MRNKAYLYLLITAFIWGITLPIAKPVFNYINPFQFLYFRYLLASVLILPALFYTLKRYQPNVKDIFIIIGFELIQVIALILLYLGLERTSVIEASILGATSPIFITLGGIIFLKEKQERKEWLGLFVSFMGALVLAFKPINSFSGLGNLLILAYLLVIAVYYLSAKYFYADYPKVMVTGISYLVALISIFLLNRSFGFATDLSLLTQPTILFVSLYMAIFASIIAFTLYLKGQALIEVSEASLFTYLQAIFALPAAYLIEGEIISAFQLFLVLIIAAGVFLAEKRV